MLVRYGRWVGVLLGLNNDPLQDPALGLNFSDPRGARYFGNFGYSTLFKRAGERRACGTGWATPLLLAGIAFAVIVPLSMLLGMLAGMRPAACSTA